MMKRMKKFALLATVAVVLIAIVFPATASQTPQERAKTSKISVILDGKYLDLGDTPPFIEGGRTYVPFDAIFSAFGFSVEYTEDSQEIIASFKTNRNWIQFKILLEESVMVCKASEYDPKFVSVKDRTKFKQVGFVEFETPINYKIVGEVLFVPVRIITESLGCRVDWDDKTRTVIINSKDAVIAGGQENNSVLPAEVKLDRIVITEADIAEIENEVFRLLNQERNENNMSILAQSGDLTKTARIKSQDMADNGYFSHISPVYGNPKETAAIFAPAIVFYGENLAKGYKTPQDVVSAWMDSPSHKEVLLSAVPNCAGVGVAVDKDGIIYWTLHFGIIK